MNETVRRANFALFREIIAQEPDQTRREMLERELDLEEARFEASLHEASRQHESQKQVA